jgi:predicted outer membrane protein
VWKHLKTDTIGPMVVISKDAFKRKVRSSMRQPQNHPVKIISFFQKPSFNTPLECSHIYELLNKLEGLTGDKFTRQYESNHVRAHKNAVSLFQWYGKNGDNPALKDWAAKTLPDLEKHLQLAENLTK